jgi:hypothetical protein
LDDVMVALHLDNPHVEIDGEALDVLVGRRVKARAARADSAVELDTETLTRWAREELDRLVEELVRAHVLTHGRVLS